MVDGKWDYIDIGTKILGVTKELFVNWHNHVIFAEKETNPKSA